MKEWYKDFIGVYENVIPKDICNQIIDVANSNSLAQRNENFLSQMVRDSSLFLEDVNIELVKKLEDIFKNKIFPLYKRKYPIYYNLAPQYISEWKVQKTLPTEGFNIFHCENGDWGSKDRVAVYTIYLNDIKEGGETEFLFQSLRIKPTQGTICIFPAGFTHTHRGNPPLSEEKFIVTGWIKYQAPPEDITPENSPYNQEYNFKN